MRWFCLLLLLPCACATTRQYTFTAKPSDATIIVDNGPQRAIGQLTTQITFKNGGDVHNVTASRTGYQDKTLALHRDDKDSSIEIDLDEMQRRLSFSVLPVAGVIAIDGSPLSSDPVSQFSTVQNFTVDSDGNWTKYDVTATREGWEPAKLTVTWTDSSADYVLQLRPRRKDLSITTNPPGAIVSVDGQDIGAGPAVAKSVEFPYDNSSGQYLVRKVRVSKPGYEPVEKQISWDDGKTDYQIDLVPYEKIVRIQTDPIGATVVIDGKPANPGPDGVPTADLIFVPQDDRGTLPVFNAVVTKKTAETEWYPVNLSIPWDGGKTDYSATLKEIMTRHVPLLSIDMERDPDGVWQILPRESDTIGMKDVSEGPGKEPPAQLYQAPSGSSIGTLAVNPAGSQILFTLVSGNTRLDLRSQIFGIDATGPGNLQEITDGKALDIMPSFTPDGNQIVFASNRAGRRLNIWRRSLNGGAGIEQLTSSDEQDLWPMIDAAPRARLFYEALSDSQPDPQLYMAPVDGGPRMDLTTIPVNQPRISPRADAILFTSLNQRTGNREIYRIPDRGGPPVDLTNDPDSDCYDPVWSMDGNMIAYVSDRGYASYPVQRDGQVVDERHRNADIWIIDLAHPDKPIQVTTNGSVDDCPTWDPSGSYIYFRSNRGGQWGIWRISVK
jgi:hypothetical protein